MAAGYGQAAEHLPTAASVTATARCSVALAGLAVVAVRGLEPEAAQVQPLPVAQPLPALKRTL